MTTMQFSSEERNRYKAKAYAAANANSPLASITIPRRDPGEHDVQIEILFCGICHSDLHTVRNEWSAIPTIYPCVPGHEIIGRVTKVGSAVTKFKPGDTVAVGCLVDSDGSCPECQAGFEQYCAHMTLTYNSPDVQLGGVTYGVYSDSIVAKDHFVLRVPSNLDLAGAAPLLCAGITTYSPMRHWGVTKGKKVGVVGLCGLGHMAVKIAHALGAHVVVFTTSLNKKKMHFASVQMRWLFREIPIRFASMKAASTLFSMLFQPNTTLTHTYDYSAAMVT
jgi:alcohol dehydrogenase (NADP+)